MALNLSKSEIENVKSDSFAHGPVGMAENCDDDEWAQMAGTELSAVTDLFSTETFKTVNDLWNHCKEKHGFDFHALQSTLKLDFYGRVRMVNFVRSRVAVGTTVSEIISDISQKNVSFWKTDDSLLCPVLANDTLLQNLVLNSCSDSNLESDWSSSDDEVSENNMKMADLSLNIGCR